MNFVRVYILVSRCGEDGGSGIGTMQMRAAGARVVWTSKFRFEPPVFPNRTNRKLPKWKRDDEDVLLAFWKENGLSSTNADRLTQKGHGLSRFRDLERIQERLEELQALFPDNNVPRMVGRSPALLLIPVESLKKKIGKIQELLPDADVQSILNKQPTILNLDVEASLPSQISMLEELLPGVDMIKLVERRPPLLYLNVKENIAQNIDALCQILPDGVDVNAMILSQPSLLWMDVGGTVNGKLERLKAICTQEQFEVMSQKPASLARAILSSHKAIDRLEYIKSTMDFEVFEKISPLTYLVMSKERFSNDHPLFETWQRQKDHKL